MDLSSPFEEENFVEFVQGFLPDFTLNRRNVDTNTQNLFEDIQYLGLSEKLKISVFLVKTRLEISSRKSMGKLSFRMLKRYSIFRALIVFQNSDETSWRLSLVTAEPKYEDGNVILSYSNPERYSYLLGPNLGVATARKYLVNLGQVKDFSDLKDRFSLEVVNSDFYNSIVKYFDELTSLLILPKTDELISKQKYAIRLFGRLIFCWFLKEKKSSSGTPLLPSHIFDEAIANKNNVVQDVLEPIFFDCLNTPLDERPEIYKKDGYELVPYLNGGLFSPVDGEGGDYCSKSKPSGVQIPTDWFRRFVATLRNYNFTIDENLNYDLDLSIDPEMLGRIFENLLAEINPETQESARKTSGSFYTPRRIVSRMTDLAIKRYLLCKTKINEEKIDTLIAVDQLGEIVHQLDSDEKKRIAEALYELRSLDPACGSGAFPIGLLQKLVLISEIVDPDLDIAKIKSLKNSYLVDPSLLPKIKYIRKLILIRDTIYGIDLQPIAIEMSKLRCFLTLIVEQEITDNIPNRGLDPLPNLEFNFLCSNTLIHLKSAPTDSSGMVQYDLFQDISMEEKLKKIRADVFSTKKKSKRNELMLEFKKATEEVTLQRIGEDTTRIDQLRSFQPFIPGTVADFFDPLYMFGFSQFDIVIGNPPYVKTEHLTEETKKVLKSEYTENKNGRKCPWVDDLYVHFVFRAFEVVKEDGIICLITNDSFISLNTKIRVRSKLLDENLLELIRCPYETFGATIYTAIFLAEKTKKRKDHYYASRFNYPDYSILERQRVNRSFVEKLPDYRLVFEEDSLVSRILLQNQPLENFASVHDAGIHSGNIRTKIFSLFHTSSINQKLLQGVQIERWAINWDNPAARFKYTRLDYQKQEIPGIGRGGKISKKTEYWTPPDLDKHNKPERILLRQTSDTPFAAYQSNEEDGQFFTDNTLFTLLPREGVVSVPLKYLLGIINSKLISYVYRYLSSEEGKTFAQMKVGLIEKLPIAYSEGNIHVLVEHVDNLILARRVDPSCDVSNLERNLNSLVCDIYELSDEEKKDILSYN